MLFNNFVSVPIPPALIQFWLNRNSDNADLFDLNINHLLIYFKPDNFTPTYDQDETGIRDNYSTVTVTQSTIRHGFEISTEESNTCAYYCLAQLIRINQAIDRAIDVGSLSQSQLLGLVAAAEAGTRKRPFKPVFVWDYATPNLADIQQGYTVRQGLAQVQLTAGTMRDEAAIASTKRMFGWRFIFKELSRR